MIEHGDRKVGDTLSASAADANDAIARLRAMGAHAFDPAGLCYLEALARRTAAQSDGARSVLEARLAQALASFECRHEQARHDAGDIAARAMQRFPHAAGELQRLLAEGDFKGLRRHIAGLEAREQCASLTALTQQLDQHLSEHAGSSASGNPDARPELKAVRNARRTWSKLSVGKQVARALEQAPKNAGPINSHMLVLRSLALMRNVSPDYLDRFMSYADALLCLDGCLREGSEAPEAPKKRPAAKAARTARAPKK
jgi:hypothetical protein